MQTRKFLVKSITIPPDEYKDAVSMLPFGEARTFSALVRTALKLLRSSK